MATYAFLETYKSARVQVQEQDLGIEIEQVAEAEKLILGMELPSLQDKGAAFVWVPSGSFMMGSPLGEANRFEEERQHPVRISRSFYMSSTEITQELYQSVMNENPSVLVGDNLPVNQVSWFDAVRLANRLSLKEGLQPCYVINETQANEFQVVWPQGPSCEGYRLPTEAEWEYAARANTPSLYAGGNKIDEVAWYEANGSAQI